MFHRVPLSLQSEIDLIAPSVTMRSVKSVEEDDLDTVP